MIWVLFALLVRRLHPDLRVPENKAQVSQSRLGLAALTTQLTWTSPLVRFSVLHALGAAATAALGCLGGSYPYWATLVVVVCSRPDQKTSLVLALQNIVATVLVALVAAVVMASVQTTWWEG